MAGTGDRFIRAFAENTAPSLPPPARFSTRLHSVQQQWLQSDACRTSSITGDSSFRVYPCSNCPRIAPVRQCPFSPAYLHPLPCHPTASAALKKPLSQREGTTLFMTLLAAFKAAAAPATPPRTISAWGARRQPQSFRGGAADRLFFVNTPGAPHPS